MAGLRPGHVLLPQGHFVLRLTQTVESPATLPARGTLRVIL